MIKTTGHNITPAVRLNPRPSTPKNVKLNGGIPNNFSSENILDPTNSATMVLAIKKQASTINSKAALFLKIECTTIFSANLPANIHIIFRDQSRYLA